MLTGIEFCKNKQGITVLSTYISGKYKINFVLTEITLGNTQVCDKLFCYS